MVTRISRNSRPYLLYLNGWVVNPVYRGLNKYFVGSEGYGGLVNFDGLRLLFFGGEGIS